MNKVEKTTSLEEFALRQEKRRGAKRCIAIFYLFLMSFQYVPVEGFVTSPVKMAGMVVSPVLFVLLRPKNIGAYFFSLLYFLLILLSLLLRDLPMIDMSVLYTFGCLCTFSLFCGLVYDGCFSYNEALKTVKTIISIYTGVLIAQQLFSFTGMRTLSFYLTNCTLFNMKFNSLTIEASHFSRLFSIYFLAFLELKRLNMGGKLSIRTLWNEDKKVFLCGFYSLISPGSGTGIVALFIILAYIFIKGKFGFVLLSAIVILIASPFLTRLEQVERAVVTIKAAQTLDIKQVRKADHSASYRVIPLINCIKNFRPSAFDFWFGQMPGNKERYPNIAIIEIYGALAYIGLLLLLLNYSFRGLFSIEVLFFAGLLGATVGNVAYAWAIMMVFAMIKYFYETQQKKDILMGVVKK